MPTFEIIIPKSAKLPQEVKMRVEADSWIRALKTGRQKVGETEEITENYLCDVKADNSIHVTDAGSGRVFRIVEIVGDQPPAAEASIGRSLEITPESTADFLEEVFELTQDVNQKSNQEEALYFMLDLAIERVRVDSGSVFLADINQHDLFFGAARGPKAGEVMKFRIKMGQGIVGFCAEEGVGLAVSDVNKDSRFYAAISEKIGYPTRSILCVPMQMEGRVVGALELINKQENDVFSEQDLNVANFIAHQLAEYLVRQDTI
jgi:putative methionine-R-sulfoxide reductase with GAF domain